MSGTELLVTAAGLAAIAWVNWYFFVAGSRSAPAAAVSGTGVQLVGIEVKGGYSPSVVRVQAGRPVRLELHRDETSGCSEEIVLGDFGIRRYLPAHETTAVEFTPEHPGRYEFTCGMGMLHGTLIVDEAAGDGAHDED
jgi:plastocyanin domain-containing protein